TRFDGQGRPTGGVTANGSEFSLTYDAGGGAVQRFHDGSVVETTPSGSVAREVTPDGTTYTRFDDQGRPTGGVTANGSEFSLTYDASGGAVQRFHDGSVVETTPSGSVAREVTPDGTTYTRFDDQGRPTAGVTAAGSEFSLT